MKKSVSFSEDLPKFNSPKFQSLIATEKKRLKTSSFFPSVDVTGDKANPRNWTTSELLEWLWKVLNREISSKVGTQLEDDRIMFSSVIRINKSYWEKLDFTESEISKISDQAQLLLEKYKEMEEKRKREVEESNEEEEEENEEEEGYDAVEELPCEVEDTLEIQ